MSDKRNLAAPDSKPLSKKHPLKGIDASAASYKRMLKLLDQRKKELPLLQFKQRVLGKPTTNELSE